MHQSSQQRNFVTSCAHLTHRLHRPIHVHIQYGCLLLHSSSRDIHLFICLEGHTRFLNFYGQPEARLNRDQSVHGTRTNQRTWFIKALSIFLFSAPDVHLRTLQKMWVDNMMHNAVWEASLKNLNDEWREFILYVSRDILTLCQACPHHQDIF
jgi:hypothetical protein